MKALPPSDFCLNPSSESVILISITLEYDSFFAIADALNPFGSFSPRMNVPAQGYRPSVVFSMSISCGFRSGQSQYQ